jgi:pyruvate dehydrogenase E1 component beta subunit
MPEPSKKKAKHKRIISGSEAIREGLIEVAKKNKNVIFQAEGVSDPSFVYGTTKNLNKIFKKKRIIEMPLSENALIGAAIGASFFGKRPVVSIHRVEFALLALEQIINNAAKAHYISMGKHSVPIVIRLVVGRGWGQGPEHSQSLENLFALIPGLKVLTPTFPSDAKGMIISAVEDNNPVIFIEHRWCHFIKGDVPNKYYKSQINAPKKIIKGNHITIVANSITVIDCLFVSKILNKYGIGIDLFDLRVCRPLSLEKIKKSIKKTGKLMTIDLGSKILGIGSEIVSEVTSSCFDYLSHAPVRIGMPDHHTPSSRGYLKSHYPNKKKIIHELSNFFADIKKNYKSIMREIEKENKKLPIDIPDLNFKGPF